MIKDAPLSEMKKFKFDMHDFDEEYVDPNEEVEPPPPTFTEEELAAAKQEAFAQGKQEGIAESKASRDQEIARILETISTQIAPFFEAENAREKIYELESVRLCHAIFKKLFPIYEEKHGLEELKEIISDILAKNQNQAKIVIEVHPDAVSAIEAHLQTINQDVEFQVQSSEKLELMSCAFKWSDGGAVKHAGILAGQIASHMEEALAAQGVSVHDSDEESQEGTGEEKPAEETAPLSDDLEEPEMETKNDG